MIGRMLMVAALAGCAAARERPGVVWWSAPVAPGESVLVHGGAWGTNPVVEAVALSDRFVRSPGARPDIDFTGARRIEPLTVTETGLCFEFPKTARAGLLACRVVSDGGVSASFIVNEPAVWWLHGDLGADASPGGWLRVFGRCLDRDGKARAVLQDAKGRCVELALTRRDVWSLDAALAPDLTPGVYAAYVHNGRGGRDGWRTAGQVEVRPYREVWRDEVFDVTAFGAVPNDGLDDTLALQAALAKAAERQGGIVHLPRGRFQCNATLRIPPRTLLRGESRETAQLYWPDCEEPPEALIEGTHAFGVEDLFIHAGKYRAGIVCKTESADRHELAASKEVLAHDITIRRVRFKLIIDQYLLKNTAEYEKRAYLPGNGIVVRNARFVRVEDCDIYCSKEGSSTLFFVVSGDYVRIANCRINGSGWAVVGGDKVIFEKNDAYNCTYSISPISRNLYWGGNRQHDLFTNNREAITHDGASVAFRGTVGAACDGTRMTLRFGAEKPGYRHGAPFWIGHDVQIIDGKGAGQTRRIESITNDVDLVIDRPWTIRPDETSRFVVAAERRRLLYVDNETEDASIAIQLYGGVTESVLARNRSARAGGFRGFGMVYGTIIPLWFVQAIENEVTEGNGYRGPGNEIPPQDAVIEIADHGNALTLTRSCVIRRCVAHNNARIVMASANGLVEGCTVRDADQGIVSSGKHVKSVLLRGNRFERVTRPLQPLVASEARLHPAERVAALLAGARCVLGARCPQAWDGLDARLARLAALPACPACDAEAQAVLLSALRAVSDACGGQVLDGALADALLGAAVKVRDWDAGVTRALADAASRTVDLPLEVTAARGAPSTFCRVDVDPVEGWTFEAAEQTLKPGGTVTLAVRAQTAAGPKGFFALPVVCTFSGDGWRIRTRHALPLLTEHRLCQWVAAGPFEGAVPKGSGNRPWQVLTNATVHGEMPLGAVFGPRKPGQSAVACAVLRVARPVSLTLHVRGPVRLFVDGRRVGTSMPRGEWGSVLLEPGDRVLRAEVPPETKGEWTFKVFGRFSRACAPGDFAVLPAVEAAGMGALLDGR
ncbi:MAG TPA: right-handed parallel beta-helix repeat-containing protein [Kiritimatiellia bacterium]|nr:right-handed parallel beta-helix repeat-containing protein [Kiritimatiellia bacterium]